VNLYITYRQHLLLSYIYLSRRQTSYYKSFFPKIIQILLKITFNITKQSISNIIAGATNPSDEIIKYKTLVETKQEINRIGKLGYNFFEKFQQKTNIL
jgi:hypothetical protein